MATVELYLNTCTTDYGLMSFREPDKGSFDKGSTDRLRSGSSTDKLIQKSGSIDRLRSGSTDKMRGVTDSCDDLRKVTMFKIYMPPETRGKLHTIPIPTTDVYR